MRITMHIYNDWVCLSIQYYTTPGAHKLYYLHTLTKLTGCLWTAIMFPAVSFLCSYQYNNYYKIGQISGNLTLPLIVIRLSFSCNLVTYLGESGISVLVMVSLGCRQSSRRSVNIPIRSPLNRYGPSEKNIWYWYASCSLRLISRSWVMPTCSCCPDKSLPVPLYILAR